MSDDDNIISMAKAADNGMLRSPEDALKDALGDVGEFGSLKQGKKILILALDAGENNDDYEISWYQAGMRMSECVSLCEAAKMKFLTEMQLIPRIK